MTGNTLFDLAEEHVDVWVWCKSCHHQAVLQTAVLMTRLGVGFPVPQIAGKCRCSACGSKEVQARPQWTARRGRPNPVPASLRHMADIPV